MVKNKSKKLRTKFLNGLRDNFRREICNLRAISHFITISCTLQLHFVIFIIIKSPKINKPE